MVEGALAGLTVVELAEMVSGPFCGRMMAAMGADVIKVERTNGGDRSRSVGPFVGDGSCPESSALYLYLNTGKKSVTLDWECATGRAVLEELVAGSDVLVENFSPGYLESVGISTRRMREANPGLVVASLSDFGSTGPYSGWQATPLVDLALGGYLFLSGEEGRQPLALPGFQPDYLAGHQAYYGCMLALWSRAETGLGQHVEVAAVESLASLHQFTMVMHTYGGVIRRRHGRRWEEAEGYARYPITVLPCKDGYLSFAVSIEHQWENLCLMMGRRDLLEDSRLSTFKGRREHADVVDEAVIDWLKDKTRDEAFSEAAGTWSVPVAPVASLGEIMVDPQYGDRGLFETLDHPQAGPLTYPTLPYRMSETPPVFERAPVRGEHNDEVYGSRLGYSEEKLLALRGMGAI